MEISIPNNKTPKWATHAPFAEFRLVLRRDGEKITLFSPPPKCYRDFSGFTGAEKDAYNAVLAHVVDTAGAAMKRRCGMGEHAETVADILAEMLAPKFNTIAAMHANNYGEIKSLIDNYRYRIEAAHEREVEKLNSVIQATVSRSDAEIDRLRREQVGNTAKMREAIVKCVNLIVEYVNTETIKTPFYVIVDIEAILKSALAAPARNCDVGTAEEQFDRHEHYCLVGRRECLSIYDSDARDKCRACYAKWAQMPYNESEAK